jgi:hypothetical protein
MAGIQFGRIVSLFSLTTHTWELLVTSEVERKMTCWDINYLCHLISITKSLKDYFKLFGFSISERTDVAFFWYEYLRV